MPARRHTPPDGIHTRRHTPPDGTQEEDISPREAVAGGIHRKKGTIPVSPSSRVAGISLLTDCRTVPALTSWQERNGEKEAHMAGKGMLTEAGQLPQGIMTGSKQCHHAAMHGHEQPRTATNNNQGEDKPAPTESPKEEQRCTTCGMARQ